LNRVKSLRFRDREACAWGSSTGGWELSEEVPELLVPPQATRESTMARARTAAKNFLFIINILSP